MSSLTAITSLTEYTFDTAQHTTYGLTHMLADGDIDPNPSYQRGSVWTTAQRQALIHSMLIGLPIPAVVLGSTNPTRDTMRVIDGKQRLETFRAWFTGELAVPADWFAPEHIAHRCDDGTVSYLGLAPTARKVIRTASTVPVLTATVPTQADEAQIYLLLNNAGTAQTSTDLANAAAVAGQRGAAQADAPA